MVGSALQAFARMETPPALHEADDSRPLDGPHFVHVPRSVARWEHKTRKLSGAFGSPHLACCTLGGAILLLNVLRSHCFTQAMRSQPRMQSLDNPLAYRTGLALLGVGGVFVLSSFLALGFTGTFLGDYFGILKETRVTTFPFSILDNPMYWGSTANYLGWAIMLLTRCWNVWAGRLPAHGQAAGIRALWMRPHADLRLRRRLWVPASGPPSRRLAQGITPLAPQSSSDLSIFWMRTSSIESCFCRKCSA
ncbi:phosphatidylethanolamine N-methyltransferase isoform X6 [Monodon monoceros]|uniref:phosphatidylethanolamine N-methyltransferase isoform X6 n=1 Tax=Monodon monoceros TaxID=40151 RepID=UPI0010F86A4C|nr:phosphatidylethanolamine N-methyltransferase isoform X6 [Monodon monoceros]XP_029068924.1 phosphatidylethanolamine N-methyltransferase isoform X6 [Monodon monoceros]XP_029068925.1 phosphatidylethanolamine N-methyltransferase isoform X6 [Monodon monoceros]